MQIIVLGMHRSGTSTVARLLNLMGVSVGPQAALIGANAENPKGFWERRDVIACNDAILHAHDCRWHDLSAWPLMPPLPDAPLPPLPTREPLAQRDAIIGELNAQPDWLIKDPRLCQTLPYWLPALERPLLVMVHRHPLAVARSLQTRNHLPPEMGLAIWEASMIALLQYREAYRCIEVDYDALLREPMPVAMRLYGQLAGYAGGTLQKPDKTAVESFIDPALNRSGGKQTTLEPLSIFQRLIYHAISAPMLYERGFTLSREAKLLMRAARPVIELGEAFDAAREEAGRAQETIREHEKRLERALSAENELAQLQAAHRELQSHHERRMAEEEARIAALQSELAQANEARDELEHRLGAARGELEAIKRTRLWQLRSKLVG